MRGRYQESLLILDSILSQDPLNSGAIADKALDLLKLGRPAEAPAPANAEMNKSKLADSNDGTVRLTLIAAAARLHDDNTNLYGYEPLFEGLRLAGVPDSGRGDLGSDGWPATSLHRPARIRSMEIRNVFGGPYLERWAHLRADPAWFDGALADERSRVLPVWNSRNLITDEDPPRAAPRALSEVPAERRTANDLILLGTFQGASFFTYEIESLEVPQAPPGTRFEDVRLVAPLLPADEAGVLGYARAMLTWRRRHQYCGACGTKTIPGKAGHVLVCTNPTCRHEQFPRIDPAIIVLISSGDRALLGRQASWPVGRYSTIAGFVEPGESLEDAVAREVFEETGVTVDRIEYHSSQPWPFPSSLMLGFTAHAVTEAVNLQDDELEDARWFSRAELASGTPLLPPLQSISFRLIEDWFDSAGGPALRDLHQSPPWPR